MPEFVGRHKGPNLASAPGSPTAGEIYYNTTDNTLKVYNGTAFQTLGAAEAFNTVQVGDLTLTNAAQDIPSCTYTTVNAGKWIVWLTCYVVVSTASAGQTVTGRVSAAGTPSTFPMAIADMDALKKITVTTSLNYTSTIAAGAVLKGQCLKSGTGGVAVCTQLHTGFNGIRYAP